LDSVAAFEAHARVLPLGAVISASKPIRADVNIETVKRLQDMDITLVSWV
jgi:hypothetical protein